MTQSRPPGRCKKAEGAPILNVSDLRTDRGTDVVGYSSGSARSAVSEVANAAAGVHHQLLGNAAMIFPATAGAMEPFPTRPIRLIAPFPHAGGGTDIVGRMLGQRLRDERVILGTGKDIRCTLRCACVDRITFVAADHRPRKSRWKRTAAGQIDQVDGLRSSPDANAASWAT